MKKINVLFILLCCASVPFRELAMLFLSLFLWFCICFIISYRKRDSFFDFSIFLLSLFCIAEKKGFEPLRRFRPTGVRSQTLQPLGYFSVFCQIHHIL